MKHSAQLDEMRDMAAAYALGALTQREARAFEEHISEGCDLCGAELKAFEQTVDELAFDAPQQEPSATVRDRLIEATGSKRPEPEQAAEPDLAQADFRSFVSVRADDVRWLKVQEGIFIKPLYCDELSGFATTLVKMMPGTALPTHQHNGAEQLFILEGDCTVRGEVLGPGDYHRAAAGTVHESTFTVQGTMFLLVAPADAHY